MFQNPILVGELCGGQRRGDIWEFLILEIWHVGCSVCQVSTQYTSIRQLWSYSGSRLILPFPQ